ncbi:hypothetical protein ABW20_dc0110104 [Dactylellina cionopaga]|nr:hypothetical protein ABW20_dc0110104 [Dactylellina cionopaga]
MLYRQVKKTTMMDYVPTTQYVREHYEDLQTDLSDLCINHIQAHLKSGDLYRAKLAELLGSSKKKGVPALTTIAMNSMINSLREDPSPSNFETVLNHAPEPLLTAIIDSPGLHYTSMLRFAEQKGLDKLKDDSTNDLWILKVWERARYIMISSFSYLDHYRPRTLKIQPSTEAYKKTFERLMGGALEGLDWNNIFVAGGMALSALLCVDESMDKAYVNNDVDMYIYGLSYEQANEKIKHIANVWKNNLRENEDFIMVKNIKTITLIANYPHRKVQILLKKIESPAAVLLNFDLDQVAIGYTGESVLFLPRCARALETGYSIFTLDMIHGHRLNERRETREYRLFKYARKGFGVRILPEFCQMVEIDFSKRKSVSRGVNQATSGILEMRLYGSAPKDNCKDVISGLKAVRRVFATGEDMTHRFYLGRTELSRPGRGESLKEYYESIGDDSLQIGCYENPEAEETRKLVRGDFNVLGLFFNSLNSTLTQLVRFNC